MEKEINLKKYLSDNQIKLVADMFETSSLIFEQEALALKELQDEGYHSLSWMMTHSFILGAKFSRDFLSSIDFEK
jgi:hypothetical protein